MRRPKICLIGNNLSNGGADKIHAVLSNYFHQQSVEVHNVIFIDEVSYLFSGELLNLGKLKNDKAGVLDLFKRFLILKKYLSENKFDYIIDFRTRNKGIQEFIHTKLLYKTPYVITVHSYNTDWYFPKNNFLAKQIFKDAFALITVSKAIEEKVRRKYNYKNATTIYNPLELERIKMLSKETIDLDFEYVLGVGRMTLDNNKQFDKMIAAYELSVLPKQNIKLVLLGDGPQRPLLEEIVKERGLTDKVVFMGFQNNPYKFMAKAKFTLLTSKFEGLPNVITESLACGTPVIAFDCKSGPSELIIDRVNGLLVEDQNSEKFTAAINELQENTILFQNCKANAAETVQRFSLEKIGRQWMQILKLKSI